MEKITEKEYVEALKYTEKQLREQRERIFALQRKLIDIRKILDRDI